MTPASDRYVCRYIDVSIIAFRLTDSLSHSSILFLTGLNRFSLTAYGSQLPVPTLNPIRYRIEPKAQYEMRSVTLFR